jgi:hypothetical protein
MVISATQIISLIIVLVIFGLLIFGLARTFRQTCPTDMKYDKKYNKCIPVCSPGTIYNDTQNKCIINCPEKQEMCGICDNQECCYNPGTNKCIEGKICDINAKDKLCENKCYTDNFVCSKDNKLIDKKLACISNPKDGMEYKDYNICPDKQFCNRVDDPNNPKCSPCDPNKQIPCGSNCCNENQYCGTDNKCYIDCKKQGKINCPPNSDNCCDTSNCIGGICCESSRITQDGNKCCPDTTTPCKTECCDSNHTCIDGICKISCGPDKYCEPGLQDCSTIGEEPNKQYFCTTKGCDWTEYQYNPNNYCSDGSASCIDNDIITCKDAQNNIYTVNNPYGGYSGKLTKTSQVTRAITSTKACSLEDCEHKLKEKNFDNINLDSSGTVCSGDYNCQNLPTFVQGTTQCPLIGNEASRCCMNEKDDGTSFYTGKICDKGKLCYNNNCVRGDFIELAKKLIDLENKILTYGNYDKDIPNSISKVNFKSISDRFSQNILIISNRSTDGGYCPMVAFGGNPWGFTSTFWLCNIGQTPRTWPNDIYSILDYIDKNSIKIDDNIRMYNNNDSGVYIAPYNYNCLQTNVDKSYSYPADSFQILSAQNINNSYPKDEDELLQRVNNIKNNAIFYSDKFNINDIAGNTFQSNDVSDEDRTIIMQQTNNPCNSSFFYFKKA